MTERRACGVEDARLKAATGVSVNFKRGKTMTLRKLPELFCGLAAGAVLLTCVAGPALAEAESDGVPSPANSELEPADGLNGLVFAPDDPTPVAASIHTLTVRNAANDPVEGASAIVEVSGSGAGAWGPGGIALCASAVLTGVTNASGEVTFNLFGGGCFHQTPLAATVKVNGITLRTYENVKSPDFDGGSGDLVVNLPDLIDFSGEFLGSSSSDCHDYDNSGTTGLEDLIIFSPAFVSGNSCQP